MRAGLVLLAGLLGTQALADESVSSFYKGRAIDLVVGYGTGGGYDTYARALAPYLTRHVPGNPQLVIRNMPGASSLNALRHVATTAPRDGSVIGVFNSTLITMAALEPAKVKIDFGALTWIGNMSSDTKTCMVRTGAGLTKLEDFRDRRASIGATVAGQRPDLRRDPAPCVRRQRADRHRLSLDQRHRAGHGARRGRRHVHGLGHDRGDEARLDQARRRARADAICKRARPADCCRAAHSRNGARARHVGGHRLPDAARRCHAPRCRAARASRRRARRPCAAPSTRRWPTPTSSRSRARRVSTSIRPPARTSRPSSQGYWRRRPMRSNSPASSTIEAGALEHRRATG